MNRLVRKADDLEKSFRSFSTIDGSRVFKSFFPIIAVEKITAVAVTAICIVVLLWLSKNRLSEWIAAGAQEMIRFLATEGIE
ncbi:MAG: hypothetical protein K1X28_00395 [Parachlamydiales bacterium]|nr:hypothetical protein [Parachlamydiales bacterium]